MPVISSNASCMPEVLVMPLFTLTSNDVNDMAKVIVSTAYDPAKLGQMKQLGFEQASKYSWERMARQTHASH